jgi:hypothetical protein
MKLAYFTLPLLVVAEVTKIRRKHYSEKVITKVVPKLLREGKAVNG